MGKLQVTARRTAAEIRRGTDTPPWYRLALIGIGVLFGAGLLWSVVSGGQAPGQVTIKTAPTTESGAPVVLPATPLADRAETINVPGPNGTTVAAPSSAVQEAIWSLTSTVSQSAFAQVKWEGPAAGWNQAGPPKAPAVDNPDATMTRVTASSDAPGTWTFSAQITIDPADPATASTVSTTVTRTPAGWVTVARSG